MTGGSVTASDDYPSAEVSKNFSAMKNNENLDADAFDRLKAAQTPFELDKAKAIAKHVKWRIDRERS